MSKINFTKIIFVSGDEKYLSMYGIIRLSLKTLLGDFYIFFKKNLTTNEAETSLAIKFNIFIHSE